jgi:hypothetical protein
MRRLISWIRYGAMGFYFIGAMASLVASDQIWMKVVGVNLVLFIVVFGVLIWRADREIARIHAEYEREAAGNFKLSDELTLSAAHAGRRWTGKKSAFPWQR